MAHLVKNLPAKWETWVQSLGWEDPLEKGKAVHSSILAWRIPQTIQSTGLQRVRHFSGDGKRVGVAQEMETTADRGQGRESARDEEELQTWN